MKPEVAKAIKSALGTERESQQGKERGMQRPRATGIAAGRMREGQARLNVAFGVRGNNGSEVRLRYSWPRIFAGGNPFGSERAGEIFPTMQRRRRKHLLTLGGRSGGYGRASTGGLQNPIRSNADLRESAVTRLVAVLLNLFYVSLCPAIPTGSRATRKLEPAES